MVRGSGYFRRTNVTTLFSLRNRLTEQLFTLILLLLRWPSVNSSALSRYVSVYVVLLTQLQFLGKKILFRYFFRWFHVEYKVFNIISDWTPITSRMFWKNVTSYLFVLSWSGYSWTIWSKVWTPPLEVKLYYKFISDLFLLFTFIYLPWFIVDKKTEKRQFDFITNHINIIFLENPKTVDLSSRFCWRYTRILFLIVPTTASSILVQGFNNIKSRKIIAINNVSITSEVWFTLLVVYIVCQICRYIFFSRYGIPTEST